MIGKSITVAITAALKKKLTLITTQATRLDLRGMGAGEHTLYYLSYTSTSTTQMKTAWPTCINWLMYDLY